MRSLIVISRILVGSLFVVSGLIKANDTLGFSYKMEKYLDKIFDLPSLIDYALPMAILIATVEVMIGFATLLGTRMKELSWLLLLMMVFFTFLTFYSWAPWLEKPLVSDCGCFGDALDITPKGSFVKNLILLALVIIIFLGRKGIKANEATENIVIIPSSLLLILFFGIRILDWWIFPLLFSALVFIIAILIRKVLSTDRWTGWIQVGTYLLFTVLFIFHTLYYLPMKDFRPYAVGKSIPEQMTVPEDQQPVYNTVFVYKNKESGEKKKIPQDSLGAYDLSSDTSVWEYVERTTDLVKEGKSPSIEDFLISGPDGQEDVTHKIIGDTAEGNKTGYVFLVVAYELYHLDSNSTPPTRVYHTDTSAFNELNELQQKAEEDGYAFYGVTGSSGDRTFEFRQSQRIMYPFFTAGKVLLKTIVRSNPGLVLLKDGKVLGKWPSTDLPTYKELERTYLKAEAN